MSDNNGKEKSRIIKTQDENGEIYEFELVEILNFDGQEYGLLVYLDNEENSEESEEEEVVIMKLSKENDAYVFETIEDDNEFQNIISYLEKEDDDETEEEE